MRTPSISMQRLATDTRRSLMPPCADLPAGEARPKCNPGAAKCCVDGELVSWQLLFDVVFESNRSSDVAHLLNDFGGRAAARHAHMLEKRGYSEPVLPDVYPFRNPAALQFAELIPKSGENLIELTFNILVVARQVLRHEFRIKFVGYPVHIRCPG